VRGSSTGVRCQVSVFYVSILKNWQKAVTPVKTGAQKLCNQLKKQDSGYRIDSGTGFAGMTKNAVFRVFANSSILTPDTRNLKP